MIVVPCGPQKCKTRKQHFQSHCKASGVIEVTTADTADLTWHSRNVTHKIKSIASM
jgi:hypothetical protein